MINALFLYTELAPYFLACLRALVEEHDVHVHLVRWPVNKEAPFDLSFHERVTVHAREAMSDDGPRALVERLDPDIVFASGWVDKGYLGACRLARAAGKPTVMCSDTAWRGTFRQLAAVTTVRFWIHRVFSHAWVTGDAQANYARRLGFAERALRKGFYSADVDRFLPLAARSEAAPGGSFPHRFLCVARYIPTKGHQYLCDAFADLCDENQAGDWELWIAGTGELFDRVRTSPSGRHPRIKHLGFIQADAMPGVMARCGVFVLPSTYEPWGVVVHEHACAGFPLLLSSAVGAAERFLVDGANGHRFIAGDTRTLKSMLRMMVLSTDDELRAMGERSVALGREWTPRHWARTAMSFLP